VHAKCLSGIASIKFLCFRQSSLPSYFPRPERLGDRGQASFVFFGEESVTGLARGRLFRIEADVAADTWVACLRRCFRSCLAIMSRSVVIVGAKLEAMSCDTVHAHFPRSQSPSCRWNRVRSRKDQRLPVSDTYVAQRATYEPGSTGSCASRC
jgi:hypothetical protein